MMGDWLICILYVCFKVSISCQVLTVLCALAHLMNVCLLLEKVKDKEFDLGVCKIKYGLLSSLTRQASLRTVDRTVCRHAAGRSCWCWPSAICSFIQQVFF